MTGVAGLALVLMHISQYRTVQCSAVHLTTFSQTAGCRRDKLFFFFLQDDNDSRRSKSTILCARSLLLVVYSLLLFSLSHSLTLAASSSSSSSFVSLRTKGINSRKDFAFTTTTFDVLWVFSYLKLTDVSLSQFVIHSPKPEILKKKPLTPSPEEQRRDERGRVTLGCELTL